MQVLPLASRMFDFKADQVKPVRRMLTGTVPRGCVFRQEARANLRAAGRPRLEADSAQLSRLQPVPTPPASGNLSRKTPWQTRRMAFYTGRQAYLSRLSLRRSGDQGHWQRACQRQASVTTGHQSSTWQSQPAGFQRATHMSGYSLTLW